MKKNIQKNEEYFEVVCDEGIFRYDDLKTAENKIKSVHKTESFGYLVRTVKDKKGQILEETFIG